ncbi:MAG: EAL domain-containing protein [Pseudomonadota bacterium]
MAMWHGIAAHFYWRQVIMIVAVIAAVPVVLLPIYQQRASEIIGSQGEVFVNTTLGATREALYKEDFTYLIQYTQQVLKTTDQIQQVIFQSNDDRTIRVDAQRWSLGTVAEFSDLPVVSEAGSLQVKKNAASSEFLYAAPVVISTYRWGNIYVTVDGSAYTRLMRNFWSGYAFISAALLFGSMAFLWLSSRPVVRQLAALRGVADSIGQGQFTRADSGGIGEIAALASALNSMSDSLEEKTQQVNQLARVVRETNEAVMLFSADGKSLFANEAMVNLLDTTEQALLAQDFWGVLGQLTISTEALSRVGQAIASPKDFAWSSDASLRDSRNPEQTIYLAAKLEPLSKTHDELSGFVLALSNITARKALERKLERLANFDTLTGLPNRRSFGLDIEQRVARAKPFSVLFMDIDHFKTVNDTLGHEAGDELLVIVSKRLRRCLPDECTIARLGGDEFTAIIDHGDDKQLSEVFATRVIGALDDPIAIAGRSVTVGVSIGVVHYPENGATAAELVKNADIAMYEVKKGGRNDFRVFSQTMQYRVSESLSIEAGLRKAILQNELKLVYQPIVNARDRRLISAEALVRWPEKRISPAVFVAIAERSNLIVQLDQWVFRTALSQLAAWHRAGHDIQLSINVSGKHVSQTGFAAEFLRLAKTIGAPLDRVQLEITENNLVDSKEVSVRTLAELRDAGCRIAVDDFGTGYSSLSYLTTLPLQVVKLDKSFTLNREGDERAKSIAKAVINLSRDLELTTIAEGVESEQQAMQLAHQGCDRLQGYHIAHPMPVAEFEHDWLGERSTQDLSATGSALISNAS